MFSLEYFMLAVCLRMKIFLKISPTMLPWFPRLAQGKIHSFDHTEKCYCCFHEKLISCADVDPSFEPNVHVLGSKNQ